MRYVYDNPIKIKTRDGFELDATETIMTGFRFYKPVDAPASNTHSGRTRNRFTHIEMTLSHGYRDAGKWVEIRNETWIYSDEPNADDPGLPENELLTSLVATVPTKGSWLEENAACLFALLKTAELITADGTVQV